MATFLIPTAQAQQNTNPCNFQLHPWQEIISYNGSKAYFQFQSSRCSKSMGVCGWPKIGLKHDFPFPVKINVLLGGVDCDQSPKESSFSTGGDYISPNEDYRSQGNWHLFKSVNKILKVEIDYEKGNDRYKLLIDNKKGLREVYINGRTEKEHQAQEQAKVHQQNSTTGGNSSSSTYGSGSINSGWQELTLQSQPSPFLTVKLAKEKFSSGSCQSYTIILFNKSKQKVSVNGTLSAVLSCGNTVSTPFQVSLSPGETAGGSSFQQDQHGLTGCAEQRDCPGQKISPDPQRPGYTVIDRIKNITFSIQANPDAQSVDSPQNPSAVQSNSSINGNQGFSGNGSMSTSSETSSAASYSGNGGYNPQADPEYMRQKQMLDDQKKKHEQERQAMETNRAIRSTIQTSVDAMHQIHASYMNSMILIENSKPGDCTACRGLGMDMCIFCKGKGSKECLWCEKKGLYTCTSCDGSGYYMGKNCLSCEGRGSVGCPACGGKLTVICTPCEGRGGIACTKCQGSGKK